MSSVRKSWMVSTLGPYCRMGLTSLCARASTKFISLSSIELLWITFISLMESVPISELSREYSNVCVWLGVTVPKLMSLSGWLVFAPLSIVPIIEKSTSKPWRFSVIWGEIEETRTLLAIPYPLLNNLIPIVAGTPGSIVGEVSGSSEIMSCGTK